MLWMHCVCVLYDNVCFLQTLPFCIYRSKTIFSPTWGRQYKLTMYLAVYYLKLNSSRLCFHLKPRCWSMHNSIVRKRRIASMCYWGGTDSYQSCLVDRSCCKCQIRECSNSKGSICICHQLHTYASFTLMSFTVYAKGIAETSKPEHW